MQALRKILIWGALAALIGVFAGSASAVFLAALDFVTALREAHSWLLALLPIGGLFMGWLYQRLGRGIEGGSNLVLDEAHDPKTILPLRMAPMIFIATVGTHLFGGSGGREGAAVQMGGALADRLTVPLKLDADERRILLMAGMSAGFGSVFGTPLAGTIFGLEVLTRGRLRYEALYACAVASLVGDQVTRAWGIQHADYLIGDVPHPGLAALAAALVAGVLFGLAGRLFVESEHRLNAWLRSHVAQAPLRPFLGGLCVAVLAWAMGTQRYLGLGLPAIAESFRLSVSPIDWLLKGLYTVLTLASGFKGGEVTPLFFVGASLGNALHAILPLAMPLLAGMGFVAVFAGASNTPLSCTLLGIELFGAGAAPYLLVSCVASYLVSGERGIYSAQRDGHAKIA